MTHDLNGWTFGNWQHSISFIPLVSHISSASPKKMFSQLDELKRSSALCRMSCPLSRRTSGLLRWYRHWECGFLSRPASFSSANRFLSNERYVTTGECFGPSLLSKISRRCTLLKVESLKDFVSIKKMSSSFLSKCPLLHPSNEKNLTIHNLLSMPLEYQKTLRMHYENHSCLKIFHSIQWQRSPEIVKSRLHIIHEAIIFFSSLRYLMDQIHKFPVKSTGIHPRSLTTVRPWKTMLGRLHSFWNCKFSGAMWNFGVLHQLLQDWTTIKCDSLIETCKMSTWVSRNSLCLNRVQLIMSTINGASF